MVTDQLLTNVKHDEKLVVGKALTLLIDLKESATAYLATWTSPCGKYRIAYRARDNGENIPPVYAAMHYAPDGFGRLRWNFAMPHTGDRLEGKDTQSFKTLTGALAALELCYLQDKILEQNKEMTDVLFRGLLEMHSAKLAYAEAHLKVVADDKPATKKPKKTPKNAGDSAVEPPPTDTPAAPEAEETAEAAPPPDAPTETPPSEQKPDKGAAKKATKKKPGKASKGSKKKSAKPKKRAKSSRKKKAKRK